MSPLTINTEGPCQEQAPEETLRAIYSEGIGLVGYAVPLRALELLKCGLEEEHRGAHIVVLEGETIITQVAWWKKPKQRRGQFIRTTEPEPGTVEAQRAAVEKAGGAA